MKQPSLDKRHLDRDGRSAPRRKAELRDGVRVVGRREGRGETSDVKPHSYSTVQHAPRMAGDHQIFVARHNPRRNPQPISGAGSARWHVHRIRYRPNGLARTFTRIYAPRTPMPPVKTIESCDQ